MTEENAIQRAIAFCQQIGQPALAVAEVRFLPNGIDDRLPYWKPQWLVTFRDRLEVRVDVEGTISRYLNLYRNSDAERHAVPCGPLHAEAEALLRAQAIFQAIKAPPELVFQNFDSIAQVQRRGWCIYWQRYFNGIPYHAQGLFLCLDAETGQLTHLSLHFKTLEPTNTVILISSEQAAVIARQELEKSVMRAIATEGVTKMVGMVPYRGGRIEPIGSLYLHPRIAWMCGFRVTEPLDHLHGHLYVVWVDAETGEIIGRD